MAVLLSCRNLTKSFDAHPLFEDLSLGIDTDARVGVIGPNGSGKSTLMRILAGLENPDSGDVALASGTRLIYLPQRDEFAASDTPESVVSSALNKVRPFDDEAERAVRVGMILSKAGFGQGANPAHDKPVTELSGGWRKRLAILRAVSQEPDLLLADEPTNHLDLEGIWWLERLFSDARFTIAVVSHDRFFLNRVCSRVVEINKLYPGGCFGSVGGYSKFLEKRAELVANQLKQQDVLDNVVRREVEWMSRNPAAQMSKSKARLDRADDLQGQLGDLKFRNSQTRRVDIDFTASGRRTNDLVVLDGVAKSLGGKPLFSGVELTLSPGTRLGMLGLNGSGKTTLLRVIAGTLKPDSGKVKLASELKIVYFDQKREAIDQRITLRRALCPTGDTVIYRDRSMHVAAWAKRFLFSPAQLELEVGKLSGGEQARVLIADLMRKSADLLILDEPTNDLDIPSLEVLESSLLDFPGAVVLVTHDRYLLDRVSTQMIALDGSGGAHRVADCSQWESLAARTLQQREPAAPPRAPANSTSQSAQPATKSYAALSKPERRELERMEEKILSADQVVAEREAEVANPTIAADPVRLEA
ncbi:MAG: ABC-F family ATP-binding cassette domain-containing protein, partial [Planctomycetota bacterium]